MISIVDCMEIVEDKEIDGVHEFVYESTDMDVEPVKKGYQIHFSDPSEKQLLIDIVENNEVVFENLGRIQIADNEGFVLILSSDWRS